MVSDSDAYTRDDTDACTTDACNVGLGCARDVIALCPQPVPVLPHSGG